MDPSFRIVAQLPLAALWDETGELDAARGPDLAREDVVARLRGGSAAVVASMGRPLRWQRGNDLFGWWKHEAKPRLLDPATREWRLDDLPGGRGWRAAEWTLPDGAVVLSFEEYH